MVSPSEEQTDNDEIEAMILGIAGGDRVCLKALYTNFKQPVFIFNLWLLKSYHMAEDMTQQTFLEIMKSAQNYRPKGKPRSWLFSIARNLCMDVLRHQKREVLTTEHLLETVKDFEDNLFVDEALGKLEELERQIVILYVFGGLKQTEISDVLGIPYMKVRSQYGYAIRKLKTIYGE